jgi:DNA-binding protein Fis
MMGYKIITQSNNNLALWSDAVQDIILKDSAKDEILAYLLNFEKEKISEWIDKSLEESEPSDFVNALNTIIENQTEAAPTVVYYRVRNVIP